MMKKAYIFDVDGTLYSQKKMHICMALELACYYLFHIWRVKELFVIQMFRKLREAEAWKNCSMIEISGQVAKKLNMEDKDVTDVVQKWMFDHPLKVIGRCAYKEVIDYIRYLEKAQIKIIIYSDYPAKEKVEALGISVNHIYTAEDEQIHELKPSKKAMTLILEDLNMPQSDIVYVGDRYEKDGKSAEMVGIEYCDIIEFRKKIGKMG